MRLFKTTYRDREGKRRQAGNWYVEFKDHRETIRPPDSPRNRHR